MTAILIDFTGRSFCLALIAAIDQPIWLWLTVGSGALSVGCLIVALIWPLPPFALWQAQFQAQPRATIIEFLFSVTGVSLTASVVFQGIASLGFITFLPQLAERLDQSDLASAAKDLIPSMLIAGSAAAIGIWLIGLSAVPAVLGVIMMVLLMGYPALVLLVIAGILALVGLILAVAPFAMVFFQYVRLLARLASSVQSFTERRHREEAEAGQKAETG